MTQCERIKEFMLKHGSITQRQANTLGVMRLAARVADLKTHGEVIYCRSKKVTNADGTQSVVGEYYFGK